MPAPAAQLTPLANNAAAPRPPNQEKFLPHHRIASAWLRPPNQAPAKQRQRGHHVQHLHRVIQRDGIQAPQRRGEKRRRPRSRAGPQPRRQERNRQRDGKMAEQPKSGSQRGQLVRRRPEFERHGQQSPDRASRGKRARAGSVPAAICAASARFSWPSSCGARPSGVCRYQTQIARP